MTHVEQLLLLIARVLRERGVLDSTHDEAIHEFLDAIPDNGGGKNGHQADSVQEPAG